MSKKYWEFTSEFTAYLKTDIDAARGFKSLAQDILADDKSVPKNQRSYVQSYLKLGASWIQYCSENDRIVSYFETKVKQDQPESSSVSEIMQRLKFSEKGLGSGHGWIPILLFTLQTTDPASVKEFWNTLNQVPSETSCPKLRNPHTVAVELLGKSDLYLRANELVQNIRKKQARKDEKDQSSFAHRVERVWPQIWNISPRKKQVVWGAVSVIAVLAGVSLGQAALYPEVTTTVVDSAHNDRYKTTSNLLEDAELDIQLTSSSREAIQRANERVAELQLFVLPSASLDRATWLYSDNLNDPEAWLRYAISTRFWGGTTNELKLPPPREMLTFSDEQAARVSQDMWVFDFWADNCIEFEGLEVHATMAKLQTIKDEHIRALSLVFAAGQFISAGKTQAATYVMGQNGNCSDTMPQSLISYCLMTVASAHKTNGHFHKYYSAIQSARGTAHHSGETVLEGLSLLMEADALLLTNAEACADALLLIADAEALLTQTNDNRAMFVVQVLRGMFLKEGGYDPYLSLASYRNALEIRSPEYDGIFSNKRKFFSEYADLEASHGSLETAFAVYDALKWEKPLLDALAKKSNGELTLKQARLLHKIGQFETRDKYVAVGSQLLYQGLNDLKTPSEILSAAEMIEASRGLDISICGEGDVSQQGLEVLARYFDDWETLFLNHPDISSPAMKLRLTEIQLMQATLLAIAQANQNVPWVDAQNVKTKVEKAIASYGNFLEDVEAHQSLRSWQITLLEYRYTTLIELAGLSYADIVQSTSLSSMWQDQVEYNESLSGLIEQLLDAEGNYKEKYNQFNENRALSEWREFTRLKSRLILREGDFEKIKASMWLLQFATWLDSTQEHDAWNYYHLREYATAVYAAADDKDIKANAGFIWVHAEGMIIDTTDGTLAYNSSLYLSPFYMSLLTSMVEGYKNCAPKTALKYLDKLERDIVRLTGTCEFCDQWRSDLSSAQIELPREIWDRINGLSSSEKDAIMRESHTL